MYIRSRRKRLFDLCGCFISLWIFTPIALIISICIFLEERKTLFFTQERIGFNGRQFQIYKFRTMTDGKVTFVGHWLRRTGLDELPQYLNVIKGDLSIVGPRPLTSYDIERLKWTENKFRWQMTPGITGLAQIKSGISASESLRADGEYYHKANFLLDCKIIVISFLMNVFGKRRIQNLFSR